MPQTVYLRANSKGNTMQIDSQIADRSKSSKLTADFQSCSSRRRRQFVRMGFLCLAGLLVFATAAIQTGVFANDPPPMPPSAQDDWDATDYDMPILIDVTANDYAMGAPLDPSTVQIVTQPFYGTATVDPATGLILYEPDGDYAGPDWFQYTVKDTLGLESNVASVNVELWNMHPVITEFTATSGYGNYWTFRGKVQDEFPDGATINLSGIVNVSNVNVEFDGSFSTTVLFTDPEMYGTVYADAIDEVGMPSNTVQTTAGDLY